MLTDDGLARGLAIRWKDDPPTFEAVLWSNSIFRNGKPLALVVLYIGHLLAIWPHAPEILYWDSPSDKIRAVPFLMLEPVWLFLAWLAVRRLRREWRRPRRLLADPVRHPMWDVETDRIPRNARPSRS